MEIVDTQKQVVSLCVELECEPWKGKADWKKIADALGISKTAAKSRYQRAERSGRLEEILAEIKVIRSVKKPETSKKEDAVDITVNLQATTPEEIVKQAGFDPRLYEVSTGKVSHWDGDKWAIGVNIRRRETPSEEMAAHLVAAINAVEPVREEIPRESGQLFDRAALINAYDIHIEKVRHPEDITRHALGLMRSVRDIYKPQTMIIPVGNDLGNFDNVKRETTKGTPQESFVSWQRGIDLRINFAVSVAENALRMAQNVVLVAVGGNHDKMITYAIGELLRHRYHNLSRITVVNEHNPRKYWQYGATAFMWTHGSDEKVDLSKLFMYEAPNMFATAQFREIHTGHKHGRKQTTDNLAEDFGVITRVFSALADDDQWHIDSGYVGNSRAMTAMVYDRNKGLIAEIYERLGS